MLQNAFSQQNEPKSWENFPVKSKKIDFIRKPPPLFQIRDKQGGGAFLLNRSEVQKISACGGLKTSFLNVSEQIGATFFFGLRPKKMVAKQGGFLHKGGVLQRNVTDSIVF